MSLRQVARVLTRREATARTTDNRNTFVTRLNVVKHTH
jgi:hypothetical protein